MTTQSQTLRSTASQLITAAASRTKRTAAPTVPVRRARAGSRWAEILTRPIPASEQSSPVEARASGRNMRLPRSVASISHWAMVSVAAMAIEAIMALQ